MNIHKKLYLTREFQRVDGARYFIHSTPISEEIFDLYWLPISKTFARLHAEGLGAVTGPRIALRMLKKVAQEMGEWDGPTGVEKGLLAQIKRLTLVIAPDASGGWQQIPFEQAVSKGLLDSAEAQEVESAVSFFTVASCMYLKEDLEKALGGLVLWSARIVYSNPMEFISSLTTSTQDESSGSKAA